MTTDLPPATTSPQRPWSNGTDNQPNYQPRPLWRTTNVKKMIEFKKYSSIENSFSREFMENVVAQVPPDMEWVVQEKVHGANTSFLCDGSEVKFAKRTALLADFLKEHGGEFDALDKCEQKSFNKEVNKLCTTMVRQVYMSRAYIIE